MGRSDTDKGRAQYIDTHRVLIVSVRLAKVDHCRLYEIYTSNVTIVLEDMGSQYSANFESHKRDYNVIQIVRCAIHCSPMTLFPYSTFLFFCDLRLVNMNTQ